MALLEQEEDFSATMSLLEEVVAARGGKLCWLPKFTPEFQPMECCYRCQNKTFNSKWLFGFIVLSQGLHQLLQGEKHRWQLQGLFAKNSLCWLRGDTWEVSKVLPLLRTVPQTSFKWCQITSTFFRFMQAYRDGATGLNVLQKTKEIKKSHRVPLLTEHLPRGVYDRKRGLNAVESQVTFDGDGFAERIRDYLRKCESQSTKGMSWGLANIGKHLGGVVLQMWNIL